MTVPHTDLIASLYLSLLSCFKGCHNRWTYLYLLDMVAYLNSVHIYQVFLHVMSTNITHSCI